MGFQPASSADYREVYEDRCADNCCYQSHHNYIVDDTILDELRRIHFINTESEGNLLKIRHCSQVLSEDQLLLLPSHVHAFSLRSRKWGM